ncbi:hypothetical protein DL95DRAFT_511411, partial [Leptodontidium sp. 2 PMI_412]
YLNQDTFDRELYAYTEISTSSISRLTPDFHGQILLPQSFLDGQFYGADRHAEAFTPYHLGIVMQLVKGPRLCDLLLHDHFTKRQLDVLQGDMRMALRKLHGVGVSHNDVKGDNFLFRTKDAKGWSVSNLESRGLNDWCISLDQESHDCSFSGFDAQESHDLSFSSLESQESHDWSVSSLCADEGQDDKDWCILDFGQAVFRLDCSSAEWEERCRKDMSDLDKMFRETRAQLAINTLYQYVYDRTGRESGSAQDFGSVNDCFPQHIDDCIPQNINDCLPPSPNRINQDLIISLLQTASALATITTPLVELLITNIPQHTFPLTKQIVEILTTIEKSRRAIRYLDDQLDVFQTRDRDQDQGELLNTIIPLHLLKLQVIRTNDMSWDRHTAALSEALVVLEKGLGVAHEWTLELSRELRELMTEEEVDE